MEKQAALLASQTAEQPVEKSSKLKKSKEELEVPYGFSRLQSQSIKVKKLNNTFAADNLERVNSSNPDDVRRIFSNVV